MNTVIQKLYKAILLFCLITSCVDKDSTGFRERNGLIKEFDITFNINSIRVDDDGEYHIVCVSELGIVKTFYDADVDWDIKLMYSETPKPIVKVHYSDRNEAGVFYEYGTPTVILPFGYKIDTFDD